MNTAYLLPQVDVSFSQSVVPELVASWILGEMQTPGPTPDLLNQNLHFNMILLQGMQVTVWEAPYQINGSQN